MNVNHHPAQATTTTLHPGQLWVLTLPDEYRRPYASGYDGTDFVFVAAADEDKAVVMPVSIDPTDQYGAAMLIHRDATPLHMPMVVWPDEPINVSQRMLDTFGYPLAMDFDADVTDAIAHAGTGYYGRFSTSHSQLEPAEDPEDWLPNLLRRAEQTERVTLMQELCDARR